jgi:hypothetical protein
MTISHSCSQVSGCPRDSSRAVVASPRPLRLASFTASGWVDVTTASFDVYQSTVPFIVHYTAGWSGHISRWSSVLSEDIRIFLLGE